MEVKEIKIKKLVKPLYNEKDKMHNFSHILRIKRKSNFLKKDYKNIDNNLLLFLIYFHGLKKWVIKNKKKVLEFGFNETHIKSLTRKNDIPIKPEEKIICDANMLENVGNFGIKKAKILAKEFNQSQKEMLILAKMFQNKYRFYTPTGKKLGKKGIKIKQNWINNLEKNLK